jgi:phosphoglycolate phosphatase
MSTKLVVFDCDGTLIDSQHMIVAAMNHAFDLHGIAHLPRAQVLSIVGLSLAKAVGTLLPQADAALRFNVTEDYKNAFHHLRERDDLTEPLFDGARAAIEALRGRDDVLLGIATGKSQRGLRFALEAHGLRDHFMTFQTADDAPSKPHPEMLLRAIREAGVDATDTVLVGDTSYDMEMARAAGAHALGVGWGYHLPELLHEAGALHVLTHFSELVPTLETLFAWNRKFVEAGSA